MIKINLGKKQENGLYGMPMNVWKYSTTIGFHSNEFLKSAVCNAMANYYYPKNISVSLNSIDMFNFEVHTDNYTGMKRVYYEDCFVDEENDIFYHFDNEEEKKLFYRKLKLKNIINQTN